MQCPYCLSEMEEGFLKSTRSPLLYSKDLHGTAVDKEKGDIILDWPALRLPAVRACCCRHCGKIFIDCTPAGHKA